MQMIAEPITKTILMPGTVIIRRGKTRCIVAQRPNRFGQVLYLTEDNLSKGAWMRERGTFWCLAQDQSISESERLAVLAARVGQVWYRLSKRIKAKHGAYVDVTSVAGYDHAGVEIYSEHAEYIEAGDCYAERMARIHHLLEFVVHVRNRVDVKAEGTGE